MSSHIAESIVRVCDTAYSIEDGHLDAIESNLEDWFHDVNRQRGQSMLLAIFRDLVSKNRLFLFLTSLAFALYYHLVGAKFSTSFQVLLISTAIVTALSTFQLLYSYFSMDRVQAYYQLPLSLNRFKGSFLTVTFLLNLFGACAVIDPLFRSQVRPATIL